MKLKYLSPSYFNEVVRRIENSDGDVIINVEDSAKWLTEFKKEKPLIRTIELQQVNGKKYKVSASI